MRSLNTHLPQSASAHTVQAPPPTVQTSRPQPSPPPPAAPEATLLSEFKAAALSVTNLYKSAFSLQQYSNDLGYTAALNDLLQYFNLEHSQRSPIDPTELRGWVLSKLRERGHGRSVKPETENSAREEDARDKGEDRESDEDSLGRREARRPKTPDHQSEDPPSNVEDVEEGHSSPIRMDTDHHDTFTFRSEIPIQQRLVSDVPTTLHNHNTIFINVPPEVPSEVTSAPRNLRSQTSRRKTTAPSRTNPRPPPPLGAGAGQKRKVAFAEFFDIEEGREGQGSAGGASVTLSKRGRTS